MKKNLTRLFSVGFLCLSLYGLAQQKPITGKVVDSEGFPVQDAYVYVTGSENGTYTDANGNYTIQAQKGDVINIEFIGFATKNITVKDDDRYDIRLQKGDEGIKLKLKEMVAVAYGTADKTTFTGSVSGVDAEQIEKVKMSDVAKALEGSISGLSVTNSTGQPGSPTRLRIRGIGSINASSAPLIILDGAPYSGEINSLNSFDIESVNALKDAASAALYGARGANGVIIITTKQGKKGKLAITLDVNVGVNTRGVPDYDILTDPKDYYETYWEALYNRAKFTDKKDDAAARAYASGELYKSLGYNVYNVDNDKIVLEDGKLNPAARLRYEDANSFNDWAGALLAPQLRREYNLSASKRTEKGNIYFSLGYINDQGYSQNSYFNRFSNKISYNTELTDWLDLQASSLFSKTNSNRTQDGGAYSNPFQWVRTIAPIYPYYVHDENGKLARDEKGNLIYDFGEPNGEANLGRPYASQTNPVATQREDQDLDVNYYLTQSAQLNAKITKGLEISTSATFYGKWHEYNGFVTPIGGAGKAYEGIGEKQRINVYTLNLNQILKYNKNFNDFTLGALVGHETYTEKTSTFSGEKKNFVDPKNMEFSNAAIMGSLDSYTRSYGVEGFFGQVTGDYKDKYYLSASIRKDGSSVFHKDNRWGTFWSLGGSWRVDREKFLSDATFLDLLKLKVSYGVQGNDYLYLPGRTVRSYTPYQTLYTITSDGKEAGLKAEYKGRKEVTWEESKNFNAGIEVSFGKGLIALELDYFNRYTNNLLFNLPVSSATGFKTEPWNIGNMVNKGFDFNITTNPIKTENIDWSLNLNGTHYKNEVLNLPEKFKKIGITRGIQKITEGGSIYDFYMVKYAGVDPTNGDALFWKETGVDANGKKTYEIKPSEEYDSNSKQYIGSAIPDLAGGFGTNLKVYGFDLAVQFSYQLGGLMADYQYGDLLLSGRAGNNWHKDIANRWTPNHTHTNFPRIEKDNQKLNSLSDRFITDASYLSLQSVNLGYSLSQSAAESLHLAGVRFYVSANNVFLWSKRKGLDPRVSIRGLNADAVYSPIRTITGGVTIKL